MSISRPSSYLKNSLTKAAWCSKRGGRSVGDLYEKTRRLGGQQNKHFDTNAKTAEDAADVLRTLLVVVTLGACVVAFATGFWIVRSVTVPLGGEPHVASEVMRKIAKGDLSAHVPVKSGDRSSLLADLASMRDGLREVINGIQKNSLEVAAAAQQVSVASSRWLRARWNRPSRPRRWPWR